MSVSEIAQSLVELCRAAKFDEAYTTLFAPDAKSIEGNGDTATGLEALHAKSAEWGANNEVHSVTVAGPYAGDNEFAVVFTMEITQKTADKRIKFEEVALYKIQDGKIIEERFLYGA